MSRDSRRRSALVAAVATALAGVVWLQWPRLEDTAVPATRMTTPAIQEVLGGSTLRSAVCRRQATRPFVPTHITVPGVVRAAPVLALGRDANNVPMAPPLTSTGKTEFAVDHPGIMPGSDRGNVLLNAHSWPDNTALGNWLLEKFEVGDKIILHGARGQELCYRVTKRDVIRASDGSWEYYATDGPPQIALIVCSWPRLGPGNWLNRTIWYASPMGTARAKAAWLASGGRDSAPKGKPVALTSSR